MSLRTMLPLGAALLAAPLFAQGAHFESMMDQMNARLDGTTMRVAYVEYLTEAEPEAANTVYARNVGNKQLTADWVPGDDNLGVNAPYGTITYLVDTSKSSYLTRTPAGTPTALPAVHVEAAIDRSMATWDYATNCSSLPIVKTADDGSDPTIVDGLNGFGTFGTPRAHLTHGGFVAPGTFAPGVLAVTFTLIWTDENGVPTDMDGNGKYDAALREIFYSGSYYWSAQPGYLGIDVETVSLHEAGHGLSQGHFGTIFAGKNGKLHFAPLAVMNAAYSQIQHSLAPTDLAGHCSIWGGWPNN